MRSRSGHQSLKSTSNRLQFERMNEWRNGFGRQNVFAIDHVQSMTDVERKTSIADCRRSRQGWRNAYI